MRDRLIDMRDNVSGMPDLTERIIEDEEIDNELLDEILDNEIDEDVQKSDKKQVETSEAENLEQQREIQEKIKQLERKKRRQRQQIFDIEDEIMEKRDNLINALEKRLEQKTTVDELFTIRWAVV